MSQAQRRIPCDRTCPIQDLRNTVCRYIELPREFRRTHIKRIKFFGKVFARMNCSDCHARFLPNGNQQSLRSTAWRFVLPLEANPPLVIDAYAVLAVPVAAQGFETVAR